MTLTRWQENIFMTLRKEMTTTIAGLTPDNLDEIFSVLDDQFDAAYSLLGLERQYRLLPAEPLQEEAAEEDKEAQENEPPASEPVQTEAEEEAPYEQPLEELAESFDNEPVQTGYRMKRNLTGGYLMGAKDGYVPESIVREQGFEDGDVIATELNGYRDGRPMYRFNLVEKGEPTDNRNSLSYLVAEEDQELRRLYVAKTATGEEIRVNDTPQRLYLQSHMVQKFGILPGDIIDVAWYGDNIAKFAVCWKHSLEDLPQEYISEERKIVSHRQLNKEKKKAPTEEQFNELKKNFRIRENDKKVLEGLSVTLVGGESFHKQAHSVITKNGGEVHIVPINTHKNRMTAAIKRSNLVLVFVNEVGHADMDAAKERAKKYNVRFKAMDRYGKENLLNTLMEEKNLLQREVSSK